MSGVGKGLVYSSEADAPPEPFMQKGPQVRFCRRLLPVSDVDDSAPSCDTMTALATRLGDKREALFWIDCAFHQRFTLSEPEGHVNERTRPVCRRPGHRRIGGARGLPGPGMRR